jgi:hypothetical protein
MAILEFSATSATLFTGVGELQRAVPCVSFRVKAALGESLKLVTGESSKDVEGVVTLVPAKDLEDAKAKGIGQIHYFPAFEDESIRRRARYIVEAFVSIDQARELIAAALGGRLPESITIEAADLDYETPDGRGVTWDNRAQSKIPLASISVSVPIVTIPDDDDLDADSHMPPTREQAVQLIREIANLNVRVKAAATTLLWAILAIAVALWFLRGR